MNIQKQIYYFILISFSILIANFIWPLINVTNNNEDIIGIYSQNNYSSLNDIFRYLTFILIPLFAYFYSKLFFEKKKLNNFLSSFKTSNSFKQVSDPKIYIFLIVFIFFLVLEFISLNFPLNEIDIFHEGQRLSSAFKSKIDGSLWSGSYVTVGIIHETLGSKLAWKFLGSESIGSVRVLDLLYILVTKISLLFLIFEISKQVNIKNEYKIFFFILLSLIVLNFISYNSNNFDLFVFREIPIILALFFFIKTLNSHSNLNYFLIGFLSVFVFFWSIDRALVLNLFIFFILFLLIYNKKYRKLFILFFSILFFWLIFYFFLNEEFILFVNNTLLIIKEHSYVNGIIHPLPFTGEKNSTRATKVLLSIIFALIISISLFFKNEKKYSYNLKIIFFSLSIICFLSYIYALGRSDGPHIKESFAFPAIFFTLYFLFNLFFYLKILFVKNNKIIFLILPILMINSYLINIDFKKIINFPTRFEDYLSLRDSNFLSEKDNLFVNTISKTIKKEKCIDLFTNDAALLYLLKKPSCTKYYFVYSIGSIKNQKDMINEMKNANFVIMNGTTDNWSVPLNTKFSLISNYIDKNYIDHSKVGERILKIRKN